MRDDCWEDTAAGQITAPAAYTQTFCCLRQRCRRRKRGTSTESVSSGRDKTSLEALKTAVLSLRLIFRISFYFLSNNGYFAYILRPRCSYPDCVILVLSWHTLHSISPKALERRYYRGPLISSAHPQSQLCLEALSQRSEGMSQLDSGDEAKQLREK